MIFKTDIPQFHTLTHEKAVTEKAYDNPKFVEDIVRDITLQLENDANITWYSVSVENFESIHNHSAYAYICSDKNATKLTGFSE